MNAPHAPPPPFRAQDLMMTVGSDLSTEDVRTAIKQFDADHKGKVSFE